MKRKFQIILAGTVLAAAALAQTPGPDPKEIPIPEIKTDLGQMPGVNNLPVRPDLPVPDALDDGTKVTTPEQWKKRREEIKRILEYYAVGEMPPPPGNVKGAEVTNEIVLDGKIKYRLVHLTFGPEEKLSLNIGIFTPATGGPFPTIILQGSTPPVRDLPSPPAQRPQSRARPGRFVNGWAGPQRDDFTAG